MANISNNTSTLIIDDVSRQDFRAPVCAPDTGPARVSRRQAAHARWAVAGRPAAAFISLGLWQWRKAETKTALQSNSTAAAAMLAVAMPTVSVDVDSLRHRRVVLRGTYDASHQVLIDNRAAPGTGRLPRDHPAATRRL